MSAPEFKAGDRVRDTHGVTGVVLGTTRTGFVAVERDDNSFVVTYRPDVLTLIPDTVSITVELTRAEADAIRSDWVNGNETPAQTAAKAVKDAVREALS